MNNDQRTIENLYSFFGLPESASGVACDLRQGEEHEIVVCWRFNGGVVRPVVGVVVDDGGAGEGCGLPAAIWVVRRGDELDKVLARS